MTTEFTDYSRPLLAAATSSDRDPGDLRARLDKTRVLVSADPSAPMALATLRVLVANLRRLPLRLYLDPGTGENRLEPNLVAALEHLAVSIDPERPLKVSMPDDPVFHAHLGANSSPAHVRGIVDGHGARLRPRGATLPAPSLPGTGLGAVLTGAMLSAEAFKVVVNVLPCHRGPLSARDFCPVALGVPGATYRPLPPLRETTLIGCGAIGTAIALILRELHAEGNLTAVDPEYFDAPNVATYSLGDLDAATHQTLKVHLVRDSLPGVDVDSLRGTARDYIAAIDAGGLPMPTTVLGAVDSISARHEIAAIHAQITLDGSTGGRAGTMLSLSESTWTGPCLRCYYPPRGPSGPSAIELLAQRTGLPLELLAQGTGSLTAADIASLRDVTPADRAILETQLDKPVCGLARAFGLTGVNERFNPSAAFVAQQAAALVVGAMIRGKTPDPANFVQYDALFGPYQDMTSPFQPRKHCRCQTDRALHRDVRSYRLNR